MNPSTLQSPTITQSQPHPFTSPPPTSPGGAAATTTATPVQTTTTAVPPLRRLLIFREVPGPTTTTPARTGATGTTAAGTTGGPHAEVANLVPVNTAGLPIASSVSTSTSEREDWISALPLRVIRAFTDIFNQPRYKNWFVVS